MRYRPAIALAALVVAGGLAVPSHAASGWVEERAYVPTKYGEMFVDFVRPASGKAPVILHITPYRYLYGDADPSASRTDFYRTHFQPQGYAIAYADLLGTGLSGGCWDYGGTAEAESGAAVVEWLGTRPWSNGKVGMIGTSYDGAIQAEIATLAPKHLAAIVPQEPVTSWYEYNYDHAVTQNSTDQTQTILVDPVTQASDTGYPLGTPDLFDFVLGTTPNPDATHVSQASVTAAATDTASGCGIAEHELRGHYAEPEFTSFWAQRDWALRANKVTAAVLMQHGWADTNTKPNQFTRYWMNLTHAADKRAILGQWDHTDVFASPPGGVPFPVPPIEYLDGFFAKWLKGSKDKAFDKLPKVMSEAQDKQFRATLPFTQKQTEYHLTHSDDRTDWPIGQLGPKDGGGGLFVNSGTETGFNIKTNSTIQYRWLTYDAATVKAPTRLSGSGSLTLRMTCSLPRGQLAVHLLDVNATNANPVEVTLGLLDLRFRDSLATAKDVPTTAPFTATVTLRPQDYVLPAGHHFRLVIAGSDAIWGVPDPVTGQQIQPLKGSTLRLPIGPAGSVLG